MKLFLIVVLFCTNAVNVNAQFCITATASTQQACPGDTVFLNYEIYPDCATPAFNECYKVDYTLASNSQPQTGSPTANPSIYGNFTKAFRTQMLYTTSDLNSAMQPGYRVRELSWRVAVFNSNTPLQNFRIGIKKIHKDSTTVSSWQTGFTKVFGPTTVTPVFGWNSHLLDSTFFWSNDSNLLVEVCHYTPGTSGSFNNMMMVSDKPNQTIYKTDNADICGLPSVVIATNKRLDMKLEFCLPSDSLPTVVWQVMEGSSTVYYNAKSGFFVVIDSTTALQVSATIDGLADVSNTVVISTETCVNSLPRYTPIALASVSPNPATDFFNLYNIESLPKLTTFILFDALGRYVKHLEIISGKTTIPRDNMPKVFHGQLQQSAEQ
jgi:hypothetical protein